MSYELFLNLVTLIVPILAMFFLLIMKILVRKTELKTKKTENKLKIFKESFREQEAEDIVIAYKREFPIKAMDQKLEELPDFKSLIELRINKLESSIEDLKTLLYNDPKKSISIALMGKDVEILRNENVRTREELLNIINIFKWLIGIAITISLGVLGLAIANFIKG